MKTIIAAFLICFSASAWADRYTQSGDGKIKITLSDTKKCTLDKKFITSITMQVPVFEQDFKGGEGVWSDGKKYAMCWAEFGDFIILAWSDKTMGAVPSSLFIDPKKKKNGIEL